MAELRVLRVPWDEAPTETKIDGELETMQQMVGGYLENVRLAMHVMVRIKGPANRLWLWVNEDGRREKLPPNPWATKLAGTVILGTAIVVRGNEEGNLIDLTDDDVNVLQHVTGAP